MPVADLAEDRQVLLGRVDHAAGVADRLDHDRRDRRRVLHVDHSPDDRCAGDAAVGILLAERAAVARGREHVQEARGERLVDGLRDFSPDADSAASVEPCHDWYRLMILYLPGEPVSLWYCRASLMAASTTSDPPHWNLTVERSPGASSASMLASCTASGLVPCIGGENVRTSSCFLIASMTRRLLWPTETT